MRNSRYDKTIDGPEVKAKDEIIASDETLTNQSNKSNKYASIVASEQRAELFDRIGTLERDNLRLGGMLCVERNRVDRLRRRNFMVYYNASHNGLSVIMMHKEKVIAYNPRQLEVLEKNYPTPDLEIGEIVFSFKIWERYLDSIPPWKSKRSRRTEQAKPLRVRALVMTINSNLPPQIHKTQVESLKTENVKDENLHGMDKELRLVLIELPTLGAGIFNSEVSPWKGVICVGKWGKLNPCYIGPFKIIAKVGTVAYRLELLEKLSRVHSTFHVSNLKKCLADEPLAIPLDEIK
ncbi:putative reverse transcriptase domain-containing protein [Tanacetum coccineum]